LGEDRSVAQRSLRMLAEQLAAAGVVALTFDYAGQGDSGPAAGVDQVQGWVASVGVAVAAARALGTPEVVVVALRVGVNLLAAAPPDDLQGVSRVVAWDPWPSSAVFLQAQRALLRFAGVVNDTRPSQRIVEVPGLVLTPEEAAAVKALPQHDHDIPSLLLVRELGGEAELPLSRRAERVLQVDEQPDFIDVDVNKSLPPRATLSQIVDWIVASAAAPAPYAAVEERPTAIVCEGVREGSRVLAGGMLSGVVAEPVVGAPAATVLLTPTASTGHLGSGAAWVELARRLAGSGVRCIRFDSRDLGDSPEATSFDHVTYYSTATIEDVTAMLSDHEAVDPALPVGVVGHCSGSWTAGLAARERPVQGVYLVHPIVWTLKPGERSPGMVPTGLGKVTRRAVMRLERMPRAVRVVRWARTIPPKLGLAESSDQFLTKLSRNGASVTVLLGDDDVQVLTGQLRRGGWARLSADPLVRLVRGHYRDHALMLDVTRQHAIDSIVAQVREDLLGGQVEPHRLAEVG
jgi:alpha-beta hydrolase superfamily lysophospholipase